MDSSSMTQQPSDNDQIQTIKQDLRQLIQQSQFENIHSHEWEQNEKLLDVIHCEVIKSRNTLILKNDKKSLADFDNIDENDQISFFDEDLKVRINEIAKSTLVINKQTNQLSQYQDNISICQEIKEHEVKPIEQLERNGSDNERYSPELLERQFKRDPRRKYMRIQNPNRDSYPNSILKGWLMKKNQGIFGGYDKRFFVLTSIKLYFFVDNEEKKLKGCINFKLAKCNLKSEQNFEFTISVNERMDINFKANSQEEKLEWMKNIQDVIEYNTDEDKVVIKTVNVMDYILSDSISEEEFLSIAETGDILLFQTDHIAATLQRRLTNSSYDHVAMICKLENRLMVFDSNASNGVALQDWNRFVKVNDLYHKIYLRILDYEEKSTLVPAILQFVGVNLGKKYEISLRKLLKQKSVVGTNNQKEEGYFCSELIAKVYKKIGLLDQVKSSCQYWPVDFSSEKLTKLLNGGVLGNELQIILQKHRYE